MLLGPIQQLSCPLSPGLEPMQLPDVAVTRNWAATTARKKAGKQGNYGVMGGFREEGGTKFTLGDVWKKGI